MEEPEKLGMCKCGCHVFYVYKDRVQCRACGARFPWEQVLRTGKTVDFGNSNLKDPSNGQVS